MFRAIKLNKYKFSDIQIIERLSVLQKVLSVLQKEICNTLQISRKSFVYLQRISFLAIKIECKMNSKVNKENMCSTGLWNAMIRLKNKTHIEKQ